MSVETIASRGPGFASGGQGADAPLDGDVEAMRRFNRFYTRFVGALDEGHLDSAFSLAEVRVLYELAHGGDGITAGEIGDRLGLDAGYLSRMLKGFRERGLLDARPGARDRRQQVLRLSDTGRDTFAPLFDQANRQVAAVLDGLPPRTRSAVIAAMETIREAFDGGSPHPPFVLRTHRPGDMGWVVSRQSQLYAREYGWDGSYETLALDITRSFLERFDPAREICYIAERNGEAVGSIFVIDAGEGMAKIRLLHVESAARGLGIGGALVQEAIRFARDRGYRGMTLWTNDVLSSARKIYLAAGFRLVEEEAHHSFGKDLVGQNWELEFSQT